MAIIKNQLNFLKKEVKKILLDWSLIKIINQNYILCL